MTKDTELAFVIDLQAKAYRLLLWFQEGMDGGWIPPSNAHRNMTSARVVEDWLLRYRKNIPLEASPDCDDPEALRAFCNLFSSFLLTSFQVEEKPGQRLFSPDHHCFCPICSWLVAVSHLKTVKPDRHDKKKARRLKLDALNQFCLDEDIRKDEAFLEALIDEEATAEDVSILAYCRELIRRAQGIVEGPAVLVLWRGFAWTRTGSPKKKFSFTIETARAAMERLRGVLRDATVPQ